MLLYMTLYNFYKFLQVFTHTTQHMLMSDATGIYGSQIVC